MTRKEEILNYIDSILDTYRSSVVINNPEPNLLEDIAIHISSKLDNIKVVVVTNGYKRSVLLQNNIRNSNHELYSSHGSYLGLKNGSSIYFAKDYTDMCSRISDVILYENADEIKELNAFLRTQDRSRLALNIFFTNNTSFKIDFPKQEVYCCPNCKHRFSKLKKVENDFSVKYFRDEESEIIKDLLDDDLSAEYTAEVVDKAYSFKFKEENRGKVAKALLNVVFLWGSVKEYNESWHKALQKAGVLATVDEFDLFLNVMRSDRDIKIKQAALQGLTTAIIANMVAESTLDKIRRTLISASNSIPKKFGNVADGISYIYNIAKAANAAGMDAKGIREFIYRFESEPLNKLCKDLLKEEANILWDNLTGTINLPHYDTDGKSFVSQNYCPIKKEITYTESDSEKDGPAKPLYIGPITDYNIASKIIKKETSDSNFKYIIAYRMEEIGLFVAIIKTTKDLYIDCCAAPEWFK